MAETEPTGTPTPHSSAASNPNKIDWRRPNPSRAIEVYGEFTEELGHKILSKIHSLRHENSDAITVYINSNGGSVLTLKYINGLLDCRDLDKRWCKTVSIATGTAASAGAILLAYGDYAYAFEHSIIHFHGIRTEELPDTFEDAAQVIGGLDRTQREVIRKLSSVIIRRVIYRYQGLEPNFNRKRKDCEDKALIELKCFVEAICKELGGKARSLVANTYDKVLKAKSLADKILPKAKPGKSRTGARSDAKVLIGVIKHDIADYEEQKKKWRLDEWGVARIMTDYLTVRDYTLGDHLDIMGGLMENYGIDFLTDAEHRQYSEAKAEDEKKAHIFLWGIVFPRLEPLWYYTVSLCRALFEGENRLTAADCYWMGIIDEVVGTQLVGFRKVTEEAAAIQNKEPSPEPKPKAKPQQPRPQLTPEDVLILPSPSPNAPAQPASQSAPSGAQTTQQL